MHDDMQYNNHVRMTKNVSMLYDVIPIVKMLNFIYD